MKIIKVVVLGILIGFSSVSCEREDVLPVTEDTHFAIHETVDVPKDLSNEEDTCFITRGGGNEAEDVSDTEDKDTLTGDEADDPVDPDEGN